MMTEKKVQDAVIKMLKSKGCYVIKTHPGLGTPTGCPDIVFFKGSIYGVIECKKREDSPWQPLQHETLAKFKGWGVYSRVAHNDNLDSILIELKEIL
jgi:Holliday junction resolvase